MSEPKFLKGSRLYLRPVSRKDMLLILKWMNDVDMRWLHKTRAVPLDQTEADEWITNLHRRSDLVSFVICLNGGRAIGLASLHSIDWRSRIASTGLIIGDKKLWGKGYASEAKIVLLHYAFDTLNLHKLWGTIFSFNMASQTYNKKCGYKVEGIQREQIFMNGQYHDVILVAVFRSDWLPAWKRFVRRGRV